MATRTPTPEQRAVIEAPHGSFTVVASAGAGKTFVLVERYLRHVVEDGLRPDQILTITFTKKAAAEMKQRIVSGLRAKGRYEDAQIAETGPIQTIHSFCERVLRENALEAGLDPQFEILADQQATRMVADAIREALASDLVDEPDAPELIRHLAGSFGGGFPQGTPYSRLEDDIKKLLHELRSGATSWESLREIYGSHTLLRAKWEDGIRRALPTNVRGAFDEQEGSDLGERIQRACKAVGVGIPAWARGRTVSDAEADSVVHTCGLVQLACAAWWRLDREMVKHQALDFAALEIRADRLLARSEVTRSRLSRQYEVVMVDESQDVNPIQYRLLDNLGGQHTMMVGDSQQSIYGFRQADVRLFQSRAESKETRRLSKNWRSDPGILNFVDLVFSRLWTSDYRPMNLNTGPMDFDSDDKPTFEGVEIWRQPAADWPLTSQRIQGLITEGVLKRDIAVLVRDGRAAVAMQQSLDQAGIPSRIAGGSEQFYTRLEVRDLANTLRCLADPYDDFSLLATLRSPMASLSLDAVVMLALKSPVVEALADLESPVDGDREKIDQFLKWYVPLRAIADRLSAWEVLSRVFAESDYLTALGRRDSSDQTLANARKLLSLASQEPELGPLEFAEQIQEIQNLRHKEGDAPADDENADLVKIMTIHKAKGLEFPVVVVPQTDKKISRPPGDVVVDPAEGLVAVKLSKEAGLVHRFLAEQKKRHEEDEERRILYVALTRAQKRLCINLMASATGTTPSKILDGVLDLGQMPGLVVRD